MHLGERHTGGKAISPLIAVSLSTCTYESSHDDLIILTEQIVILPAPLGWKWNRRRLPTEASSTVDIFDCG